MAAKFSELIRDRTKIFFANKYLGLVILEGERSNCPDTWATRYSLRKLGSQNDKN